MATGDPLMLSKVADVDVSGLAVKLFRVAPSGVEKPTTVPLFEIPLMVVPAAFGVGPSKLVN